MLLDCTYREYCPHLIANVERCVGRKSSQLLLLTLVCGIKEHGNNANAGMMTERTCLSASHVPDGSANC